MLGWLLNVAYITLLIAVSPVLLYRMLAHGKYREGWRQKFLGDLPIPESHRPRIWFHAVSVGEVLQLRTVLSALQKARPDCEFLISTTTATGMQVARKTFPGLSVIYFPLDFTWSVRRALGCIRPAAVVLVELELWPNFIHAAAEHRIPITLINGRISERSFRGYRWIRPLTARMLGRFTTIAVQNATYAGRFCALGAPASRVHATGSIKFDAVETDRRNSRTAGLRKTFCIRDDEVVFVAGSTQAPEEQISLDVYRQLRARYPKLRFVLVPRHQERFEEVAKLVMAESLPLLRRSDRGSASPERPVLLLDTLGELAACWGLADVAFVGGSLGKRGGQNMIEPAGYGAALLFGPNIWNFADVVESLLSRNAAKIVTDAQELAAAVSRLLDSPDLRQRMGERARQLVLEQKGAANRTVELILDVVPPARQAA